MPDWPTEWTKKQKITGSIENNGDINDDYNAIIKLNSAHR